jgi:hypothetical protein
MLDDFGEISVKRERVFELKYLQYWFCHARDGKFKQFDGNPPGFLVRKF